MIGLTGPEEAELRRFVACLEVKPPLVNVLRKAVREFIDNRMRDPDIRKRYNELLASERSHLTLHR